VPDSYHTPPEVARRLRVNAEKVLGWIRRGELRAVNVADRLGRRPRYRIALADLLAFEAARQGAVIKMPLARRRRQCIGEVNYF